jgi:uncharacterized protein (TIGR02145 family)
VGVKISILQESLNGTAIYTETQTPTTNANGLITIEIGGGAGFSSIDWSSGPYFLKTETDISGGTNYSVSETIQLLSVPYALYSKNTASYNETDPLFGASPANGITGENVSGWNTSFGWGNHTTAGYLPGTRNIRINNSTMVFSANMNCNVGTVTSVGLTLPDIFSVSGSPVTVDGDLGVNLVSQNANLIYASPDGSNGIPSFRALVPNDITGIDWAKVINRPTILQDYGITDGVSRIYNVTIDGTKTFSNTIIAGISAGNKIISNVADPENVQDVATKAYVDALSVKIEELQIRAGIKAKDIDGNVYNAVSIGNQVWMAANLKTTKYRNGNPIGTTTPATLDISAESSPKYQWAYGGNEINVDTYGRLYTWYAVTDTRNICPSGWHVPTDAEWTTLENYLIANGFNYDGTTTGNKIAKALASASGWNASTNSGAVGNTDYPLKRNVSGFTALPGGYRNFNGTFALSGNLGFWWSATQNDASNAWARDLNSSNSFVTRNQHNKKYGFSVRCIRD